MSGTSSDIPELRDWFENAETQQHAARLGMWIFLTSEVLLFAGLFGLYTCYRLIYPYEFLEAAQHNDVVIGTVNTFVLITSSFTVAWSIHAVRTGKRGIAVWCLGVTLGLGAAFLALKGVEYSHHIHEGILPGRSYNLPELPGPGARLFFTSYYLMTGLHALHVLGGMITLAVIAVMTWRGRVRRDYATPLENAGLYWHLVDVIWIFLWPLLYLV